MLFSQGVALLLLLSFLFLKPLLWHTTYQSYRYRGTMYDAMESSVARLPRAVCDYSLWSVIARCHRRNLSALDDVQRNSA